MVRIVRRIIGSLIFLTFVIMFGAIPASKANYPASPVASAPTALNQILTTTTEIEVNANLDNVQSVSVTVNGRLVLSELTGNGTIVVGTLIGPKDKVDVKIKNKNGVETNVVVSKSKEPVSLANVNFSVNSSQLNNKAKKLLVQVAKIVKSKGYKSVSLIGFTDQDGSRALNERLALARANAVEDYLRSLELKVKFIVDAQADENPVAENNTKQGKALNRRVEIIVE